MTGEQKDFEAAARAVLPEHVAAYYGVSAGSGAGEPEGRADWAAIRFRPRVLRDVSQIDTATTVLGTHVRTPVMVAPMAQQLGAHPEGEVATGRAAAATGSLLGVSTHTPVRFEDISATGVAWWFQVYVMRDRSVTELLVRRAVAAGARALVLTLDMNALLPVTVNPRNWPEGTAKTRLANLTAEELAVAGPDGIGTDGSVGPEIIGWLRDLSGLPVVVKGLLRADDAHRCVEAGADGVVVSTHGGRRMGPSTSAARALPEIVAAVDGRAEVYVDSGLRSGEHVAAALAMGARAVFVGRPALWALAGAGQTGVAQVIGGLTSELALSMQQLGAPTVADLTPDLIAGRGSV